MTYEADIGGRVHAIAVEPVGHGRFRLLVDGVAEQVVVRETDLGLSIIFADGRVLDAALTERGRAEWLVQFPHATFDISLDSRQKARASDGLTRPGAQRVTAPMPGRVLRVLVKIGDAVDERQGLLVIEAMKMENEIGAPKAGVVKAIAVSEGLSIEAGRLLVVVE